LASEIETDICSACLDASGLHLAIEVPNSRFLDFVQANFTA